MILTVMAMYLNIVHGSTFDYVLTFIGDVFLLSCISR